MTSQPTVDKFPTFKDTCLLLKEKKRQCIWYLPTKGRLCQVRLTEEDESKPLKWAIEILSLGVGDMSVFELLAKMAEELCCARHHRNRMYGSGMAQKLAIRWGAELAPVATPDFKVEWSLSSSLPSSFARHQVHESESLFSQICSDIEPQPRTTGSIYFYTHQDNAVFAGMVKIGYTTATVQSRLRDWSECGHGYPQLLGSIDRVRHPKRVELLTHFELLESWHALRWCKNHAKSHIEWFKVEFKTAHTIAELWSRWMDDANPYDRRGCLQTRWKEHIEFLQEHGNPITAKAMTQIHAIEVGLIKVDDFIDDEALRRKTAVKVKAEVDEDEVLGIPPGLLPGTSVETSSLPRIHTYTAA